MKCDIINGRSLIIIISLKLIADLGEFTDAAPCVEARDVVGPGERENGRRGRGRGIKQHPKNNHTNIAIIKQTKK
ncbi:MAG: hypothetical protein MJE68_00460 [Proteobacteria bacterium]|nr:hypothetical protein [Pseudomonadota bacterium]